MKMSHTNPLLTHPLLRRLGWVLYAIMFYLSGESFVIWLLEPENFTGGIRWLGVVLFPLLFIGFFFTQRHLGCTAGYCRTKSQHHKPDDDNPGYMRPPGF